MAIQLNILEDLGEVPGLNKFNRAVRVDNASIMLVEQINPRKVQRSVPSTVVVDSPVVLTPGTHLFYLKSYKNDPRRYNFIYLTSETNKQQ